jgi:hypothetical protein
MNTKTVKMTAEEAEQFEVFRQKQAEAQKKKQQEEDRKTYKKLVDETIDKAFPAVLEISDSLKVCKKHIRDTFRQALDLKAQIFDVKSEQRSNTFTHGDGKRRIILGEYELDAWDDTINEGIAKVKKYIGSLAKDTESKMLVNAIMKLLSKDKEGNLRATRVIQLEQMARESGSDTFIDGVRIIKNAHRPTVSKTYIRAECKDENGAWVSIPLGITEA